MLEKGIFLRDGGVREVSERGKINKIEKLKELGVTYKRKRNGKFQERRGK